jgi:NAD(P)-dependent dehydrogenase (short-subunit alcohol dehydrogenase family)
LVRGGHGVVVNVGSRVAERASPNLLAYTASKGAMQALMSSIAVDYASKGIRANTVAPGFVLGNDCDEALPDGLRAWTDAPDEAADDHRRLVRRCRPDLSDVRAGDGTDTVVGRWGNIARALVLD